LVARREHGGTIADILKERSRQRALRSGDLTPGSQVQENAYNATVVHPVMQADVVVNQQTIHSLCIVSLFVDDNVVDHSQMDRLGQLTETRQPTANVD